MYAPHMHSVCTRRLSGTSNGGTVAPPASARAATHRNRDQSNLWGVRCWWPHSISHGHPRHKHASCSPRARLQRTTRAHRALLACSPHTTQNHPLGQWQSAPKPPSPDGPLPRPSNRAEPPGWPHRNRDSLFAASVRSWLVIYLSLHMTDSEREGGFSAQRDMSSRSGQSRERAAGRGPRERASHRRSGRGGASRLDPA